MRQKEQEEEEAQHEGGLEELQEMDQEESGPRIIWGQRADTDPDMVYFDHDNPTNLTVLVGHRAHLPCRVLNLNSNNKKNVSVSEILFHLYLFF